MIAPEETRHLTEGPREGETPGGAGLVEIRVGTAGDVRDVFDRARTVLRVVLDVSNGGWPSEDGWRARLPDWFVTASAPEQTAAERARWLDCWRRLDPAERARVAREKPWSLGDWLVWLEPGDRQWYWWDAVARGRHEGSVYVQVPGWPAPVGALEWLLRAAGADSVSVVE